MKSEIYAKAFFVVSWAVEAKRRVWEAPGKHYQAEEKTAFGQDHDTRFIREAEVGDPIIDDVFDMHGEERSYSCIGLDVVFAGCARFGKKASSTYLIPMIRHPIRLALILVVVIGIGASQSSAEQSELLGERMPYAAFDALPKTQLEVEGAKLDVASAPGTFVLPKERILAWVERSAIAVSVYYGRFPVPEARILIVPVPGKGARRGTAFGYRGPAVRFAVGTESTEADLRDDWKAVHEMIHLALPNVTPDHLWLAEGIAVYVESIARVQAGHLRPEKIWHEFVRDMPQGLPKDDDGGLEGTTSWGRTYWGGALFCLLADVELRKRSGNNVGLQDALRGIVAAGGTHDKDWPISRITAAADKATGLMVLSELYEKMGKARYEPDLNQLWNDLGVLDTPEGARLDDRAALADVRRAITAAPRVE